MQDLYIWDAFCTTPTPPCGNIENILIEGCPQTATWFWVLAAIAGAVVIARKTS